MSSHAVAQLALGLGLLLCATRARAQFGKENEPADTRTSLAVDSIYQRRVRDCGGNSDLVACEARIQQERIRKLAEEKAAQQAADRAERERAESERIDRITATEMADHATAQAERPGAGESSVQVAGGIAIPISGVNPRVCRPGVTFFEAGPIEKQIRAVEQCEKYSGVRCAVERPPARRGGAGVGC
jgi:hypothetical protein